MKTTRICLALLGIFISALNSKIQGATITWTNTQGGLWSEATNWSPNKVPSTNDTALITTPGTYTVATDQTNYVLNLTIGASGGSSTQTLLFTNCLVVGSNTVVQGGGLFEITNAISFTCRGSVSVTSDGVLTEYAGFLNFYFMTPALIITNGGVVNAFNYPSTFDSFLGIYFPAEPLMLRSRWPKGAF